MNNARSRLEEWFNDHFGEPLPENGDTDLFKRFGIEGDDAGEFIESFVAHFQVDAQNYRWYFHHQDEGTNFGALFFKPIYKRVERLPITPNLLIAAVETQQWPIKYPPHDIPSVRWDIRLNQLFLAVPIILLGVWLWQRFVR